MIRTPTPKAGRDRSIPQEIQQENINRTRHRSKEVMKEIETFEGNKQVSSTPQKLVPNLAETLGLDISSSSADETSPVKKNNKRKRKRCNLGFSGPLYVHEEKVARK